MQGFRDRRQAGGLLAKALSAYAGRKDAIVLAIPRGGLEVAAEVAKALCAPLDVVVSKKIGHPHNPEVAIGAVSHKGFVQVNEEYAKATGVSKAYLKAEEKRLGKQVDEKRLRYTQGRPFPALKNKVVILVDDGVATGSTMAVAVKFVRPQKPEKIVVAVPVAPPDALSRLRAIADEVVCLLEPSSFTAVGEFYERFLQVVDEEAIALLKEANSPAKRRK